MNVMRSRILNSGRLLVVARLVTGAAAGASNPPPMTGAAYALATLAPEMGDAPGAGDSSAANPSYASPSLASSPVAASAGDLSEQFIAPNGQVVTVTVKRPVTVRMLTAPPIADGEDPVDYFSARIAAAGSGSTLLIPKASYDFPAIDCAHHSAAKYHVSNVNIDGLQDVVIDGQGSTLNFASDCPGIVVQNSQRIVFRNFTVDWPHLRNSAVGTVVGVGGDSTFGYAYDLKVPPADIVEGGFDAATAWDSGANAWSLEHPTHDIYLPVAAPRMFSQEGLAVNVPSYSHRLDVGESMLVRHLGVSNAINIVLSEDVTMDNVRVLNAPSIAFLIAFGRGLHLTDCHVDRAAGRPISAMGDAVHFDSYGGDVIIENSSFAYQGDDGLNMHTQMLPIAAKASCASPAACPAELPPRFYARDGDPVALFGPDIGLAATRAAHCAGDHCTVDMAPIAATGGYAMDMKLANARYIVRNNVFSHNRARGFLAQTPYGLVQHNVFVGQSLFALYLVTSSFWNEGAGAQDVLFLDNRIASPGTGGGLAAVTLATENAHGVAHDGDPAVGGRPPLPATEQDIVFADNSFADLPGPAFYISSANNVVLYKNSLGNPAGANAPIAIHDASNIFLSGNSSGASALFSSDPTDVNIVER